tara:strand:- start:358 stop:507 length:150 start_codon:yes stop_codon:yes gene_type:complete
MLKTREASVVFKWIRRAENASVFSFDDSSHFKGWMMKMLHDMDDHEIDS